MRAHPYAYILLHNGGRVLHICGNVLFPYVYYIHRRSDYKFQRITDTTVRSLNHSCSSPVLLLYKWLRTLDPVECRLLTPWPHLPAYRLWHNDYKWWRTAG